MARLFVDSVVRRVPGFQHLRHLKCERAFRDGYGQFRGVYTSFAQAAACAPRNRYVGHSWPDYATHHIDRMDNVQPYDYPVSFWLPQILSGGRRVFDYGGNVGVHFHAYRKYMTYPADLRWTVGEPPELVKLGRQRAEARGYGNLEFTTDFAQANRSDVLLAAGVLQYVEEPLADKFGRFATPPMASPVEQTPTVRRSDFNHLAKRPGVRPTIRLESI